MPKNRTVQRYKKGHADRVNIPVSKSTCKYLPLDSPNRQETTSGKRKSLKNKNKRQTDGRSKNKSRKYKKRYIKRRQRGGLAGTEVTFEDKREYKELAGPYTVKKTGQYGGFSKIRDVFFYGKQTEYNPSYTSYGHLMIGYYKLEGFISNPADWKGGIKREDVKGETTEEVSEERTDKKEK